MCHRTLPFFMTTTLDFNTREKNSHFRHPSQWSKDDVCYCHFQILTVTWICTDWPSAAPSLLQKWYWVSFPEVKQPASWRYHPPPSSAEVKERVELYLNSLSGSAWPVSRWILPFTLCTCKHWQQVLEVSFVLITRCSLSHQRISSAKTKSPGVQVWLFYLYWCIIKYGHLCQKYPVLTLFQLHYLPHY